MWLADIFQDHLSLSACLQYRIGSRFLLLDNDGVFRCGGFEAGFSSLPADELPAMPETARELPMSYVTWIGQVQNGGWDNGDDHKRYCI